MPTETAAVPAAPTPSTAPAGASAPAPAGTVEEYAASQRAEYGRYVAAEAIQINGANAFGAGDPVPASHISRGVVDVEFVHDLTTPAGRAAAGVEKG